MAGRQLTLKIPLELLVMILAFHMTIYANEPQVYLPSGTFDFKTVVDGTTLEHDFVLQNKGNAPLKILDLIFICGCTAATSVKEIPPGEKGNIRVKIKTEGYGGMMFREKVTVKTNDPNRPRLELAVYGKVEKFADVNPSYVQLEGPTGKWLAADIEIFPRKTHPFMITGFQAENGKHINHEIVRQCSGTPAKCIVRVINTMKTEGRYTDVLYVTTDSSLKPRIPVYINGIIQ